MKNLRKLRALPLLLVLMALLTFPALAANEYQDGDFKFTLNQARATITGYTGEGGTVVVPSQVSFNGKSYPVAELNYGAFSYNSKIVSVTLPNTITKIGKEAFYTCQNLEYLDLPDGLTFIPYQMCANCKALRTVIMPTVETALGENSFWWPKDSAFKSCTSLTTIDLSQVTFVGDCTFNGCTSLKVVSLPKCTYVGKEAFLHCESITKLTFSDNLETISSCAFQFCTNLASASLGNNVKTIDSQAFRGCTNLASVSLGNNVKKIGVYAFGGTALESAIVPDSVEEFDYYVFSGCSRLKTVDYHFSRVPGQTFGGCTSLTEVQFYDNLEYIDYEAFADTASLESITIPKKTRLHDRALAGAPVLTTIYGYKNSSAEEYANKNGLVFIPLNEPEEQTISVSKNSFTMALKSTLSLKASSSSGIVDYQTSDPSVATVSSDGTVSAQGIGRAIITITAPETDEYQSASRLVEIIVCPKKNKIKSVSGNKKAVTVKWTRDTAAQGYLVQWCKKSSFKGAKSATITTNGTVSKVIKKPGKGKWYFRVGSYKTINGKKQCVWSKSVSKTLK